MAEIIRMPKLGFDMQEGLLVRWVKMEGDAVQKGDILAEIETDKATVEVEANGSGKLFKHLVETDTSVPIGEPIAVVADEGEEVDLDSLLGPTDKKESESDSTAEVSSKPKEQEAPKQEESATEKEEPIRRRDIKEPKQETGFDSDERIKASPLAKKMADDHQLSLEELSGSGPGGRIIKKDIEAALSAEKTTEGKQKSTDDLEVPTDKKKVDGLPQAVWQTDYHAPADETNPMNKLRQAIGRRMVESKQQVPHFYVTSSVNVEDLMSLYKQVNESIPKEQKISINDYVIKATALALRAYPGINSSVKDDSIIQHGAVNIGVAVAVEGGLLTVVVRDADVKPIRVISNEVKQMVNRVRSGKIKSDDVEGSTFSISNLGMFDVENFAAIINPPEAAILAVSSANQIPVVSDGEIKVGWRMKVTLSADHRVTDGVEASEFLQVLTQHLEKPLRLLL